MAEAMNSSDTPKDKKVKGKGGKRRAKAKAAPVKADAA